MSDPITVLAEFVALADHKVRDYLDGAGHSAVTPPLLRLLQCVGAQPGVTASALAAEWSVSAQSVSHTMGALFDAGYLSSEPDAEDRRKRLLHLTDRGSRLVADVAEVRRRLLASVPAGDDLVDVSARLARALTPASS